MNSICFQAKFQVSGTFRSKRQRCLPIFCNSGNDIQFRDCTVIENRAENLIGSVRSLVLSVDDNVQILQGRKISGIQESKRWIDKFQKPGQFVLIKTENENGSLNSDSNQLKFPISNSPYAVRADSAYLAASIIEILVENGTEEFQKLAELGPGGTIQVSEPQGNGFCSLFNKSSDLSTAMEDRLPILMIGQGVLGMAAFRSVLDWTPLQAHAGNSKVTLLYLTPSRQDAPYVKDWDKWRDAGIVIHPLFGQNHDGAGLISSALVDGVEGSFMEVVGGNASKLVVLIAGLDPKILKEVSNLLKSLGVQQENLMLCEYF